MNLIFLMIATSVILGPLVIICWRLERAGFFSENVAKVTAYSFVAALYFEFVRLIWPHIYA